ncbi:MAG: hypothetical protein US55_C0052G0007 [Candidatus Levybacteria bacterium GW2011_GWC2_37_7]|nr:MAG: hypothetical protein US55_C0052G0007 [Candidatus Levybacteria bacterium GW2011_GWC2_37_7]
MGIFRDGKKGRAITGRFQFIENSTLAFGLAFPDDDDNCCDDYNYEYCVRDEFCVAGSAVKDVKQPFPGACEIHDCDCNGNGDN